MPVADIHGAIDAVWRIESAKVIATLTRIVRDVGLAEDLAQEALVAALERWPHSGVPENPGAWLTHVAKLRAIDFFRRDKRQSEKHQALAQDLKVLQALEEPDFAGAGDDDMRDDLLRLIFIAC